MISASGVRLQCGGRVDKNADEEVKAVADYVTGSNDEDGVAKAIARFVLGETVQ